MFFVGLLFISYDNPTSYSVTYTSDAAKNIVRAFVACRLDWCNSLLYAVA